jgi:UDP-N-acetylmuramoylalanine--D-glutamate ligase
MTVLVVGAAVSGRAATSLLRRLGEKVGVYDVRPEAVAGIDADAVHSGPWDPSLLDGVDLVVTSPGVPPWSPSLADARQRGLTVWSEIELAFRHLDVPLGAVTGTNGKTTVAEATSAMLIASGLRSAAVGNIGEPMCDAVGTSWDALAVEASSFQLAFVDRFRAGCAVLLNIAPDHLDWHGSFEAYAAAKRRILERQAGGDLAVHDADDPEAAAAMSEATGRVVAVSGRRVPAGGAGRDGDLLRVTDRVVVPIADMARADDSFIVDLAAAAVMALHLGATADGVEAAARAYRPGRHRREVVAQWDGVTWVDDSKATNPHAAIAAIRAHEAVVLIAGGRPKGLDVTSVAREPNVRHLVGIGEAGPMLVDAARSGTVAGDMAEAVEIAAAVARPGETVLLAPACASFDMFGSYAERGDAFAEAVRSRGGV